MESPSNSNTLKFNPIKNSGCLKTKLIISNESPMEKHNAVEVGFCLSGNGTIIIENCFYDFKKGNIIIIKSNDLHKIICPDKSPCEFICFYFNLDKMQLTETISTSAVSSDKDLLNLLKIIHDEYDNQDQNSQDILKHLFISFSRKVSRCEFSKKESNNSFNANLIFPAINYISTNFNEQVNIENLAGLCNLSPSYFRRIFKMITNKTPIAYINDTRIQFAENLLVTSNFPFTEICRKAGFLTTSSFNRIFINKNGVSPRAYRKNNLVLTKSDKKAKEKINSTT